MQSTLFESETSHTKVLISFSIEIANLCYEIEGVDAVDVMQGVHMDYRLSPINEKIRIKSCILF